MIFSKDVGQKFEMLTAEYIHLLQTTRFDEVTAKQMSVETLWNHTWQATMGAEN
jgi:hypothetical protein